MRIASRAEALEAVRKGNRTAAVILQPGFGPASERLFYGDPPEIEVFTDPSRQAERGMLEGLLQQQGAERMQTLFSNPAASRQQVQSALSDLEKGAPGSSPALETFLGQLDSFLATPDAAAVPGNAPGGTADTSWMPLRVTMADLQRQRTGPRNGYDAGRSSACRWRRCRGPRCWRASRWPR